MTMINKFLNHPVAISWGNTKESIITLGKSICDVMVEDGTVLMIGTGLAPAQYFDWPNLLSDIWGVNVTYLEVFDGYVNKWKGGKYPVIKGDVREIDKVISTKYDTILWLQGPEHVHKDDVKPILEQLYNLCNKGVLCTCPWGSYYDYQNEHTNGNMYENHIQKSLTVDDFSYLEGYEIFGCGVYNGGDGQIVIKKIKE